MSSLKSIPTVHNNSNLLWHVAVIATVIAWGVSFVFSKVLLEKGLSPTEVYVYRFTIAYLLLVVANHKKLFSNTWVDEVLLLVCGMCAGSIYFIAENYAMQYTLVSNVSLITTMSPLLTLLLLGAIYRSERPSSGALIGSGVAFVGVACVVFNSSFVMKLNPLGDTLSLCAAFSFAIYGIILKRLSPFYSVAFISRKTFFYGLITALPFLLMQPEHVALSTLLEPTVIANLLFLAVICSTLAFMIWAECIKRLGTVTTNNYLYFQPVFTLIASVCIGFERLSFIGIVGCVLILVGVWLSDWLDRRPPRPL